MTKIEWTDDSWNPLRGCSMAKGSELGGCLNCYAARQAARNLPGMRSPTTGEAFAILTDSGPRWTGKVELIESKLLEPLHWRKPRRVFVNSMSDLFHENLPDEAIDRIFAVMALTPHITYQVLTKRAERMREWVDKPYPQDRLDLAMVAMVIRHREEFEWPLQNLWLGVSVENQPTADERIQELLRTPAAVRFVSYEPALEEVDFEQWIGAPNCCLRCGWTPIEGMLRYLEIHGKTAVCIRCDDRLPNVTLDWGIIGGESGPVARPFDLKWARNTISQFKAAGVPLFVKQFGSRPVSDDPAFLVGITGKGGSMEEWPPDLRVRQFPKGAL